ncbi:Glu/Leu/Phe/Val dehydrogenase dimerization domain-containing protein [Natronococcus sp. A-GB1]|uniref:Leu/Phe/Val dehydrogenase n=1 Tax=Natronococcus sp. A-GB1 TaxID=3037648 RepID=UPI00241D48B1|nr:Glu/Leu/Phe/Val dehydrogenase dimerization domain-containing protein [Natronococcus sp. A-GB1]MDG5759519.1 Glu/Leu/Phe/Val dehydrogenase dimerization domain-containing protein [Natronococcus sp. A-GB1]
MVFDSIGNRGHEQVSYFTDTETGLRAIVAIHDTTLGPSLGGTRILDYDSEADALEDVLRLSHAMTYKAAAADLPLGGGKAVILGDPDEVRTEATLEAYGRAVDRLGGRYITSVDINSSAAEMDVVARDTDHVVGASDGLENPSGVTAHGVFCGIRACVDHVYGVDDLEGLDVVVQGLGKVGQSLAEELLEAGAAVTVSDVDREATEAFAAEHGANAIEPDAVYEQPCDVFAPCAVGGILNDETIPTLECEIVAGAANNVLAERRHAEALRERGILYAPDYVINAGGLVTVAKDHFGGTYEEAYAEAEAIEGRLRGMIERADEEGTTVLEAAEAYAKERIAGADGEAQSVPRP